MEEFISKFKKSFRKKILEIRNNIPKEVRDIKSQEIFDKLIDTEIYKSSKNIMCFVSYGSEVDTHKFITHSLKEGKTILVPIIIKKEKDSPLDDNPKTNKFLNQIMKCSKINSLDELKPNSMGILEPTKESINIVDECILDLIIVPGTAFDIKGNRMGYGGGFYDRFIDGLDDRGLPKYKLGICFDEQILDEVPTDIFDEKMDLIITDQRIIEGKRVRKFWKFMR